MNDTHPWFSEEAGFFGPEYLVEYESVLPHEQTLKEVSFLEEILAVEPGAMILDVPCGHGRHSVQLAARGYCVTGVDLNNFFLEEAKKAVAGGSVTVPGTAVPYGQSSHEVAVSVEFRQGDMRELAFDSKFDVALNLFTAMGYFETDEDDLRFFSGVHRALKSGGQFVVDFFSRDWMVRNFQQKDWRELSDGSWLIIEREHDPVHGKNIDRRIRVAKDGTKTELTSMLRVYTATELVKMAESVGFALKDAYGNFDGDPLNLSSKRTILHFKKQ